MGYLTKDYLPTLRSTSSKILETIKKDWIDYMGNKRISTTAMATPKGVKFFVNKFSKMTDEEIRELYENHRR